MTWEQASTIIGNFAKLHISNKPSCRKMQTWEEKEKIINSFITTTCVRCTVFIVDVWLLRVRLTVISYISASVSSTALCTSDVCNVCWWMWLQIA